MPAYSRRPLTCTSAGHTYIDPNILGCDVVLSEALVRICRPTSQKAIRTVYAVTSMRHIVLLIMKSTVIVFVVFYMCHTNKHEA